MWGTAGKHAHSPAFQALCVTLAFLFPFPYALCHQWHWTIHFCHELWQPVCQTFAVHLCQHGGLCCIWMGVPRCRKALQCWGEKQSKGHVNNGHCMVTLCCRVYPSQVSRFAIFIGFAVLTALFSLLSYVLFPNEEYEPGTPAAGTDLACHNSHNDPECRHAQVMWRHSLAVRRRVSALRWRLKVALAHLSLAPCSSKLGTTRQPLPPSLAHHRGRQCFTPSPRFTFLVSLSSLASWA